MNIFYYDLDNFSLEEVAAIAESLPKKIRENTIFLPKETTLLLDCSTVELYRIKEKIEEAIHDKEILNEM